MSHPRLLNELSLALWSILDTNAFRGVFIPLLFGIETKNAWLRSVRFEPRSTWNLMKPDPHTRVPEIGIDTVYMDQLYLWWIKDCRHAPWIKDYNTDNKSPFQVPSSCFRSRSHMFALILIGLPFMQCALGCCPVTQPRDRMPSSWLSDA